MLPPDTAASLAEWLAWQESLHPKTIELGLGRVREVAARLGLPNALPALTVAGTNGKGSSTALLGEIYRAAGLKVGVYTSPHLLRYNERIAINGEAVSDSALCDAFNAIEQVRQRITLTYFEFGTLAALWLFREAAVQLQILEVGLGGRLDAVNLVDAEGMLITSIGLDHQDWLGPDRESIGREKAGVLRAGKPAVYADWQPVESILEIAAQLPAPLHLLGRDFSYAVSADAWTWSGVDGRRLKKLPMPGLGGTHQLQNAAGVIALVEALQSRLPVSDTAVRSALPRLHLAGRFERIGGVLFDVAHNAEAAQALVAQLEASRIGKVVLVLGMLADKPVEAFCRTLAPWVSHAYLAGLPGSRGLSAQMLQQRAGGYFKTHVRCDTVPEAFVRAKIQAQTGQCILVCGSFLTVAAVKAIQENLDG